MPRESLRQEEVFRRPIHVRDRDVTEGVERVEAVESGSDLEIAEEDLEPPFRERPASLGAE